MKNRERLQTGVGFAIVKAEKSRFNGIIKRIRIITRKPTVEEMFELQDYYASSECGNGFEREAIHYTFKSMQMYGFSVKLFKKGRDGGQVEVDLSNILIFPSKAMRKKLKKNAREHADQEVGEIEMEEVKQPDDFVATPRGGDSKKGQAHCSDTGPLKPEDLIETKVKAGTGKGKVASSTKHKSSSSSSSESVDSDIDSSDSSDSSDEERKSPNTKKGNSKNFASQADKGKLSKKKKSESSRPFRKNNKVKEDDSSESSDSDKGDDGPKRKKQHFPSGTGPASTEAALAQFYAEYQRQEQLYAQGLIQQQQKPSLFSENSPTKLLQNSPPKRFAPQLRPIYQQQQFRQPPPQMLIQQQHMAAIHRQGSSEQMLPQQEQLYAGQGHPQQQFMGRGGMLRGGRGMRGMRGGMMRGRGMRGGMMGPRYLSNENNQIQQQNNLSIKGTILF